MPFFLKRLLAIVSRTFPVFNLRIPEELKERIEQSARESKRSQNAEYLYRLERSFHQEDQLEQVLEELKVLRQAISDLQTGKASDGDSSNGDGTS